MTTETTIPTTTHLSVDLCSQHGHAMLAVVTTDGNGYGAGVRLLGPKSCCVLRREVARWPVTADDLQRLASDLTPAHLAPPPTETTTPRRIDTLRWTPAERTIADAVQAVERLPADVRLTDAVILLQRARDRVADYVDGVPPVSVANGVSQADAPPPPASPSEERREATADAGVYHEGSEAGTGATRETRMRRYLPNFADIARGVLAVTLPLGSPDAIERLARDLVAFGYGMGESAPESSEQFAWFEKAEAAHSALMENVAALATRGVPSSVVLALDPSRSTPAPSAVAALPAPREATTPEGAPPEGAEGLDAPCPFCSKPKNQHPFAKCWGVEPGPFEGEPAAYACTTVGCSAGDCPNCVHVATLTARLREAEAGWTATSAACAHEQERAEAADLRVRALEEERDAMIERVTAVGVRKIDATGGRLAMDLTISQDMALIFAEWASFTLDSAGAENYVEMQFRHPDRPEELTTVTVRRWNGKTPNQLQREAEATVARLEEEQTAVQRQLQEQITDKHRILREYEAEVARLEEERDSQQRLAINAMLRRDEAEAHQSLYRSTLVTLLRVIVADSDEDWTSADDATLLEDFDPSAALTTSRARLTEARAAAEGDSEQWRDKYYDACRALARRHNNPHCACVYCEDLRSFFGDEATTFAALAARRPTAVRSHEDLADYGYGRAGGRP